MTGDKEKYCKNREIFEHIMIGLIILIVCFLGVLMCVHVHGFTFVESCIIYAFVLIPTILFFIAIETINFRKKKEKEDEN